MVESYFEMKNEQEYQELVSIVIPTLNRATYLEKALLSVLGQSYQNLEIIILDEGGSDATLDMVNTHDDKRIRYVRHPSRLGFVANWTYGVRIAHGDYICILGDDDLYDPSFIESRVAALKKCSDAIAATGAFRFCDGEGKSVRMSRNPLRDITEFAGKELIQFTFGLNGEWFIGATMYRTGALRSVWDKAMCAGTALDLAIHVLLAIEEDARIVFIPEPQMWLRVHPGQESRSNNLWLGECAARAAMHFWFFEDKTRRKLFSPDMRKCLANAIDHYARMLWDKARVIEARHVFFAELATYPWRLITWLRYLRTYLPWLWPRSTD